MSVCVRAGDGRGPRQHGAVRVCERPPHDHVRRQEVQQLLRGRVRPLPLHQVRRPGRFLVLTEGS